MNQEAINVLYCGDNMGAEGMEASIFSLLTYTKNVNIFIFSMTYERQIDDHNFFVFQGVSEDRRKRLHKIVKYLDPKGSKIVFFDTLDEYMEHFVNGVNENDGHSSPYAPLRLLADLLLPYVPHVLYLDCDTIIQSDVRPMYFEYLNQIRDSNYAYAAYTNEFFDDSGKRFGGEMVAGVLLFDLEKTRELRLLETARYNITHKWYKWYDQSALEEAGGYIELEQKYNYMKPLEKCDYTPTILHFADELNPKVYFEPDVFYRKFPHLQYIKDGITLIETINF